MIIWVSLNLGIQQQQQQQQQQQHHQHLPHDLYWQALLQHDEVLAYDFRHKKDAEPDPNNIFHTCNLKISL